VTEDAVIVKPVLCASKLATMGQVVTKASCHLYQSLLGHDYRNLI
jgi:hypothetical protein